MPRRQKHGLEGLCAPALTPASTLGPNRRLGDAGRPYPQVSQSLSTKFMEVFKVLCEAAAAAKPGECSLDDPAFGQDFETFGLIGALDDFDVELRERFGEGFLKLRSLIAAVGKELFQKWEQAEQRR